MAWQERIYDCVQYLLAGLLLPLAVETLCASGVARLFVVRAGSSLPPLVLLALGADLWVWCIGVITWALADWTPDAGLIGQTVSILGRLGIAYSNGHPALVFRIGSHRLLSSRLVPAPARTGDPRMIPKRSTWILAALSVFFALNAHGQEKVVTNPVAGDPAAILEGASLFRGNCSPCHGLNAQGGGRGPDLTAGRWVHGSSDADIFRTITRGVPGTEMPANGFEDSETWAILAYLRSLAPAKGATVSGDPAKGEKVFWGTAGCATCHMVQGRGGVLGPDLSRVGEARSADYLIDSIRQPSKELSNGILDPNNHYGLPLVYDTVTVVTVAGERVVGVARNEDTFSIQLMDTHQSLQFFLKKNLKEVTHERKSLMPVYAETMLKPAELQDLVAYLETLRDNYPAQ